MEQDAGQSRPLHSPHSQTAPVHSPQLHISPFCSFSSTSRPGERELKRAVQDLIYRIKETTQSKSHTIHGKTIVCRAAGSGGVTVSVCHQDWDGNGFFFKKKIN